MLKQFYFMHKSRPAILSVRTISSPTILVLLNYSIDFVPKHAHGTENIDHYTSSTTLLCEAVLRLYDRIVDPDLLLRRMYVVAENVIFERDIPEEQPVQLDFFSDPTEQAEKIDRARAAEEKEHRLQQATLKIQEKYGKNAILKGMNFLDGGTTIERNGQIGGHKAD